MIPERFENPAALNFLWFLPLLVLVAVWMTRWQAGRLSRALGARLAPVLLASASPQRRKWKFVLEILTLACLILALARPQSGESKQKVKSEGVEIMLLVDVSQSMMAEDVRPSRLELVKKELTRFLDQAGGDKVGLVAFAGSAVLLSPLTGDKSALKMFIESLAPISVTTQGTDFRKALHEAKVAFERGGLDPGDEGVVSRLVVLVSDGEDNEPGAVDAARELVETGVRIFTLAVGTEQGGRVPLRDERGNLAGYLKDKNHREVITKTVGDSLRILAEEGKGSFHHMTFGGDAVPALLTDISRLQKAQFDSAEMRSYNEEYQKYLALGLFFAALELLLSARKKRGRIWRGRFEVAQS